MKNEESLAIIHSMIQEAKKNFHRISIYFIIWGFLLALCGIAEYILVYQMNMKAGFMVWALAGIIGGIATTIYSRREDKQQQAKSYYDAAYGYLWGGFGIALFLIILCSIFKGINPTPYVLLATGVPTFASGGLTKFKPLLFGAFVFWIAGVAAFFVPNSQTGILFSVAMVFGYLLPGYLLQKSEAKANE